MSTERIEATSHTVSEDIVELRSFPVRSGETPQSASPRTLYCVPAAGVGARAFLMPFAHSRLRTALRVVQLPGREDRLHEPAVEDVPQIARALAASVHAAQRESVNPSGYALFGHSFGAMVVLETARVLEDLGAAPPAVLAVAGCVPPHLPSVVRFEEMDDDEIVVALADLGGVDLRGDIGRELAALVLPALRADCRAFAGYLRTVGERTVGCPVLALSGSTDDAVPLDKITEWRRYTRAGFTAQEVSGDHFFPVRSEHALWATAGHGRTTTSPV